MSESLLPKSMSGDSMQSTKIATIIVPTYNRQEQLRRCLASLARQTLPQERFEVIVVDDGSVPRVPLDSARKRFGPNVTIIFQGNQGPSKARNAGAHAARGRCLLFTDDDCEPRPDWAENLIQALENNPEAVVGGRTTNALKDNRFAEASQLLNSFVYAYYNEDGSKPRFFASNNLGISRVQFIEVGGFSTRFTTHYSEDRDFCDKWIQQDRPMLYEPHAIVEHSHHMGFFSFLKQHFQYGTGARLFHLERRRRNLRRPPVESQNFYLRMLAYPFREEGLMSASILSLLIFLTQVAHTLGYVWQRFWIERRHREVKLEES